MDCREVQDWLLSADDVRPEAWGQGPAAEHLSGCAECRQLAERLAGLEQAWRAIPLGPQCEQAKRRFLEQVAPRVAERRLSRRRLIERFAVASAASVLAGAGAWLFFENRRADASDDLVDSLLDWNLRLTQAGSADERSRVYSESGRSLEEAVARFRLPSEHSLLAAEMLENGKWLASHRDPLGEAARFDDVAGRLLRMARAAEKKGKYQRMNRLLDQYNRAMESGIDLNLVRAETSAATDARRQQKLQRLLDTWDDRVAELARIDETAPEPTRKRVQRALNNHQKQRKKAGKI